jgi:hypothetical protein
MQGLKGDLPMFFVVIIASAAFLAGFAANAFARSWYVKRARTCAHVRKHNPDLLARRTEAHVIHIVSLARHD